MAAALAAFYAGIPVGHVEAGLRTWDKRSPFPEEINRVMATHLSDLHFAPTQQARRNLLREGIAPGRIVVTGNTVIDALFHVRSAVTGSRRQFEKMFSDVDFSKRMILITGHRRENFGEGFLDICRGIRTVARRHPRGGDRVSGSSGTRTCRDPSAPFSAILPNVHLMDPQPYLPFVF